MNPRIQIISVLGSLLVMALVFELIRRRKLREEYALLWFGASLALIAVSLWRRSLDFAARLVGVAYSPSVLFLGVILLGFFLAIHYSIALSRLEDQNKRLAQEVALLRHLLEREATQGEPQPALAEDALGAASEAAGRIE
ncbi:MAG TPA: DUF2304 domain-containing protein [Thermomicrobiales bacterium]|nr:DUF2304 domain-containing protein [Thermomicrobiales bacterium]